MGNGRRLPTVCILAGGLGTRLGELTASVPKALIEVAGEPFLNHQLRLLKCHGAHHIVLCVGHLGELIEATIGRDFGGLAIEYHYDSQNLDGTLGAIRGAAPLLGERFLVLYGDTFLLIDYEDVVTQWVASGLPAVMTVLHNEDRWERSNAVLRDSRVLRYDKRKPSSEMEWIDYGLGGLTAEALRFAAPEWTDLADLYSSLAAGRRLAGYEADEPFHDIGTPERLAETASFLRTPGMRSELCKATNPRRAP